MLKIAVIHIGRAVFTKIVDNLVLQFIASRNGEFAVLTKIPVWQMPIWAQIEIVRL